MKYLLTILIFFIGNWTYAQLPAAALKEIRANYKMIRENLDAYHTERIEIWEESTEGGEATAYYDGSELKLIEVVWLGEMGSLNRQYYFDKGKVFFAFEQKSSYNRPIYWDKQRADENGDSEVFDPEKTTVEEERYYFYKGKLAKWLNPANEEVDVTDPAHQQKGESLLQHVEDMKRRLEKDQAGK